jgi:hypothetical protein
MTVVESRLAGAFKSALSIVGWLVVAVSVLSGSTFVIAWIATILRGGPAWRLDNLLVGLACSLIALLFIGVFHLRKETVQLRVSDRNKFRDRLQIILHDLGYQLIANGDNGWRARPRFRALLFGDGINVVLVGNKASLTGPRLSLELIRRRYRMVSHLEKVQESISDSKCRVPETYLKRVELSARLEPKQLDEFHEKIIDVLANHGTLLVDVQLMLISENGMKESLWSNEMRPWLEECAIPFEYHRDLPQRASLPAGRPVDSCLDTCVWT